MVFLSLEGFYHFVDKVVDIEKFQFNARIIDRIRKIIGDSIAEGSYCAIVVGTAPFAEKVRETVNKNLRSGFLPIIQKQILPRFLAASVFGVPESSAERSLLRRGQHHRAGVAVFLQGIEKGGSEAEVPFHVLGILLGAVDSGEVEDEVRFLAVSFQFFRKGVDVVLEDFVNRDAVVPGLALLYVEKLGAEVLPHESLGACY